MADTRFVGDTKDFSEKQLQFVSEVIDNHGFKIEKIHIEPAGKIDDNFVASVKRISVEKNGTVFKMIAKVAPKLQLLRDSMNARILFNNEHIMYTKVLPKLTELQKAADIPNNERYRYTECYGNLMDEYDELILLEDLKLSNYTMLDRLTTLSDNTIRLVLKNFAALHSMSYALKNQEPETYAEFRTELVNTWILMYNVPDTKLWSDMLDGDILEIVEGDKHRNALKGLLGKLPDLAFKNARIDAASKYSIIQQGDSWTNNIMFQMEENNPVSCCLIDYQLSKESSPVGDILYLIFACTDYETRAKHFHSWMEYYHSELDKALADYGLKANLVYPRDQLDVDLRRYGKMSLGIAVMLQTVLVREMADAAKMKEMMQGDNLSIEDSIAATRLTNLDKATLEKLKNKVEGYVDSFLEFGLL